MIISAACLLVRCLLGCLTMLTRNRASKDAELLVLRHENAVLRRQVSRVHYEPGDRLDRLLIVNESHLRQVLTEYLQHYNTARPHRSLGQLTPAQADTQRPDPVNLAEHWIRQKQILGGLTREYFIAALPPSVATGTRRSPPESYFRAPQPALEWFTGPRQLPARHSLDTAQRSTAPHATRLHVIDVTQMS